MVVPCGMMSTSKIPSESKKTVAITFPAEIEFLFLGQVRVVPFH
jgi:hypothetical protein